MKTKILVVLLIVISGLLLFGCIQNDNPPVAGGIVLISTCSELQALENNLTGSFELAGNIDCSESQAWNNGSGFDPIGSSSGYPDQGQFAGKLDGKNFAINGLFINRPTESSIGVFAVLDNQGQVTNLKLGGATINGKDRVGSVAGENKGEVTNIEVTTSTVNGSIEVGGIIGQNYGAKLTNANFSGTVRGKEMIGGIIGNNSAQSTISSCVSSGNISGDSKVGGVAGYSYENTIITSCDSTATVIGPVKIGGLVGSNYGSTISASTFTGSISTTSTNYFESSIGSIVGESNTGKLVGVSTSVSGFDCCGRETPNQSDCTDCTKS